MKPKLILFILLTSFSVSSFGQSKSDNEYVALSQDFLESNIRRQSADRFAEQYKNLDLEGLSQSLDTYEKQLAFWINTYNAFIQYQLLKDPSAFEDRSAFYSSENINIGGTMVNFDLIEHGVIRNSRLKLGLGYIRKLCASKFERMLRLKGKDGRVHFALNCGAISCPPVAVYGDKNLDAEMTEVIKFYLPKVTAHDSEKVKTSPLFSWFRGDFGGKSGIKDFLSEYDIIEVGKLELEFGDYDWTLDLENFYTFK